MASLTHSLILFLQSLNFIQIMFFSPSPITKSHKSSTDQLNRYLPEMDQSQSQKQHVLYTNFSTVEQISKSIDMEKERLDEENILFNQRLNQCSNVLSKGKRDGSDLKHKIESIKFGNSFGESSSSCFQQLPMIPLDSIYYRLNEKPKSSSSVQKGEINMLLSQIQKLEKDCAKLYLDENSKFQQFEEGLLREFDRLNEKMLKGSNQSSEYALLQLKVMEDQEKLHNKIKKWQTQLNQEFQDKIIKLIERIQNCK